MLLPGSCLAVGYCSGSETLKYPSLNGSLVHVSIGDAPGQGTAMISTVVSLYPGPLTSPSIRWNPDPDPYGEELGRSEMLFDSVDIFSAATESFSMFDAADVCGGPGRLGSVKAREGRDWCVVPPEVS